MKSTERLFQSIYPDAVAHPERMAATSERVAEVARIVLGDQAPDLTDVFSGSGDGCPPGPRTPLDAAQARRLVDLIAAAAGAADVSRMTRLLEASEISAAEAIELHETFKIPVSHLESDVIPVRGQGVWIEAIDGRTYMDLDSNYSAANLGFSNEEIGRALFNQASLLIAVKEDRVHAPRARFLKLFRGMLPEDLTQFYWQNSGGEAVDKSLKMAKAATGRTGVVAFENGFHGRTHGAISVTHNLKYRKPFGLDETGWAHFAPYNDAEAVARIFAAGKARTVIMELVQSEEAGIRPAEPEFVRKIRAICTDYDGVLIFDEVQSGFGRAAEKEGQWFACQTYGVTPDIIVIGKSFGGGFPLAAVVTTNKISEAMKPGYDGSTFGGNPMAMAAAVVAFRQMNRLNLTANVVARSGQISAGLAVLGAKHPVLGGIRIKGLFIGFDLPSSGHVALFQEAMKEQGVITSLSTGPTVRLLPPLLISSDEVEFMLQAIDVALSRIAAGESDFQPAAAWEAHL